MSKRAVWLLVLCVLSVSCAARQDDVFRNDDQTVRIEVLNLNWSDATLWVHRDGDRRRLGIVSGKGEGDFEVTWRGSYRMQLEIDLLAGDRCFTPALNVDPGDTIYLELVENMRLEFACSSE